MTIDVFENKTTDVEAISMNDSEQNEPFLSDATILSMYREVMERYEAIKRSSAEAEKRLAQSVTDRKPLSKADSLAVEAFGRQLADCANAMVDLVRADKAQRRSRERVLKAHRRLLDMQHEHDGKQTVTLEQLEGPTKIVDVAGGIFRMTTVQELREKIKAAAAAPDPSKKIGERLVNGEFYIAHPVLELEGWSKEDFRAFMKSTLDARGGVEGASNIVDEYDEGAMENIADALDTLWQRQKASGKYAYWEQSDTRVLF